MIAVYSVYSALAIKITEFVHKNYQGMKVIWGGPHCIAAPELSLRYADGVCFCEGDECVVELVNKLDSGDKDYLTTPNMAFNIDGKQVINEVSPPLLDLDSLPFYDYDLNNHFIMEDGLHPLDMKKMKEYFTRYYFSGPTFFILTSRGCPHQCSYCNNSRYVELYGKNSLRFQSVGRFIDELEAQISHLGFISQIYFADDDFFARPTAQIEEFAIQYKAKIRLPFALTVSANTFREKKMEILLDAGLKLTQMGIQSGSQRVMDEVYNRPIAINKTWEVVRQIETYMKKYSMTFMLDFIIDNPYETKDDIIQTYRYLVDLPKPVETNLFCLVFLPGTPIYARAVKDGIIQPFEQDAFKSFIQWTDGNIQYQKNYETFLVIIAIVLRRRIPKVILRFLGSRLSRSISSLLPGFFYVFLTKLFLRNIFPALYRFRFGFKRRAEIKALATKLNNDPGWRYFVRGLHCEDKGEIDEAYSNYKNCIKVSEKLELIKMASIQIKKLYF